MTTNLVEILVGIGLTDKAAQVYLAALDLGEATVKELASRAHLPRTTIYHTIDELLNFGALLETRRDKKVFYLPAQPQHLLKRVRENVHGFEDALTDFETRLHSAYPAPRTYFLYGVAGFKQIWDRILDKSNSHFDIITAGESFIPFVREKYILDEIIALKKKRGITSRQLITDSRYARKIIATDKEQNRVSKLLPITYRLPYTTIICAKYVAFISPRTENMLIAVEGESFAQHQLALFNALWDLLDEKF